jgi:hypothetical protein
LLANARIERFGTELRFERPDVPRQPETGEEEANNLAVDVIDPGCSMVSRLSLNSTSKIDPPGASTAVGKSVIVNHS